MIKNLIFTGGGLKGWAYIGTIRALKEFPFLKKDIEQVIGVSVGSLFGLCYILDISWEFLLDYFMEFNIKEYIDIDINNLLVNQSLLEGSKFIEILKEIIGTKINCQVTFKELFYFTDIKFTVNALNISDSKLEYFNYHLTPDIKIIDAIRASCNLPIIFPPYRIGKSFYYDGGICNNCPVDLVDELCTIAFDVSHLYETSKIKLVDLINTMVQISNQKFKGNANVIYKILDPSFKDEFMNFSQTRDDIFNIYMNGYTNSKNILFNFFSLK